MKWLTSIMGCSGYENSLFRLQTKKEYSKYLKDYKKVTTKMAFNLSHVAYDESDFTTEQEVEVRPGVFQKRTGLWCHGCKRCFTSQAELDEEGEKNEEQQKHHRRTHFSHGYHTPPIFKFIEIGDYYICILHLLLRITGALWKNLIGKHITTKTQAASLTKLCTKFAAKFMFRSQFPQRSRCEERSV